MTCLNHQTLVLNKNWQAIGVAPVHKSLVKLWEGRARIVDPADYSQHTWDDWAATQPKEGEKYIQCVGFRLRVPEVITLTTCAKVPPQGVTFTRRNIFKRDRYTCQYCGKQPGSKELSIDHVYPKSRGGTATWENSALACTSCNARKADRTPEEAGMRLLHQPVKPKWRPDYASRGVYIDSWSKFLSETYWSVPLESP